MGVRVCRYMDDDSSPYTEAASSSLRSQRESCLPSSWAPGMTGRATPSRCPCECWGFRLSLACLCVKCLPRWAIFLPVNMFLCVWVFCLDVCLHPPEECWIPGSGVKVVSWCVGVRNWTWILWKMLSHLSIPISPPTLKCRVQAGLGLTL